MRLPISRDPFSVAGAFLATIGALFFCIFFLAETLGLHSNPYMGIVFYMLLPGLFIFGLLLIPFGAWRERRRVRRGEAPHAWPRIDLNLPQHRRTVFFVVIATFVNVLIVSLAAYSGVHYMDSNEFCGQVCHTVMQPEYTAFQDSPHSRVGCAQCHIGSGAPWFVKAKISGVRQIFAVAFNTYERPIPSPVHNLRPPRETCEQCHWPEKFHGDKVVVVREFGTDEKNTESTTTMQVHIGGGSDKLTIATGIHFWHMNTANEIRYKASDDKRQVIPWVKIKDRTGAVREFTADGTTPEDLAKLASAEERVMDCVDCHNRPSHTYAPSAEKAVDRGLAMDIIPRDLPFIKREAASAISAAYPTQQAAADAIAQKLREFYRTNYADIYASKRPAIERAVSGAQLAYARNVFPEMKVGWGTYPNNIGHMNFPGCFRCHDDSHKTTDGKVIKQDCTLCHTMQ